MAMLTNRQANACHVALFAIGRMETNALPALPLMLQCLNDPNEVIVISAIQALSHMKSQPILVVTALTNFLVDSRFDIQLSAANALQQFGSEARPAVPFLQRMLSDRIARFTATNALLKIAPEALTNVPAR
jgi:HEAT repeat protein